MAEPEDLSLSRERERKGGTMEDTERKRWRKMVVQQEEAAMFSFYVT